LQRPSLRSFILYFLRLGTLGFGGPIALAGHMQQDLVERRGWITALGATLVGLAFVGPSFVMVLILSALYVRFGGLPWMQGLFYGIGAAVIAIIARSVLRLVRMTLGRDRLLWSLFASSALVTHGRSLRSSGFSSCAASSR
jgi:chromate transporter